jgi:CDP-paratose 2-epimerase
MRCYFLDREASTAWNQRQLGRDLGDAYRHYSIDIRDSESISE